MAAAAGTPDISEGRLRLKGASRLIPEVAGLGKPETMQAGPDQCFGIGPQDRFSGGVIEVTLIVEGKAGVGLRRGQQRDKRAVLSIGGIAIPAGMEVSS